MRRAILCCNSSFGFLNQYRILVLSVVVLTSMVGTKSIPEKNYVVFALTQKETFQKFDSCDEKGYVHSSNLLCLIKHCFHFCSLHLPVWYGNASFFSNGSKCILILLIKSIAKAFCSIFFWFICTLTYNITTSCKKLSFLYICTAYCFSILVVGILVSAPCLLHTWLYLITPPPPHCIWLSLASAYL